VRKILWISLIYLLVFAFGCAPSSPGGPNEPLAPPAQEAFSPTLTDSPSQGDTIEMNPTTPADAGLQNLIERAKEDLAQRLKIVLTEISLIDAKAVVWPDASLGCPQPGMKYKQVPEDGALIVLQVNGINYEYHNGGSRGLFLCQKAAKDPNPPPKIDLQNLTPSRVDPSNPGTPTPDNGIPPGENQ
jgi:hypothetical protein